MIWTRDDSRYFRDPYTRRVIDNLIAGIIVAPIAALILAIFYCIDHYNEILNWLIHLLK
jgi:hypothetical protein